MQKERQPQITFKEFKTDGMIAFEFITSKAKAISLQVDANVTAVEMARNLVGFAKVRRFPHRITKALLGNPKQYP